MKFRVWEPEQGETLADARSIEAQDSMHAAEVFAESAFNRGDPFPCIELRVMTSGDDVYDFTVDVEAEPVFRARLNRSRVVQP